MNASEIPIACNMNAIPAAERDQHEALSRTVFSKAQEIIELDNGYEFVFPVDVLLPLAEFISRERLCCPFWDFNLNLAPGSEQIRVRLTGPAGVQGILKDTLAELAAG
jgi:hypothetical protein